METAFLPEEKPSPPCLSLTKADIAFVIGTVLGAVVALYVVAPMAFVRSAGGLHQERYITSVLTSFTAPTTYIGVNISFDYFYKKDETRLRVVMSLPNGYSYGAADNSDSTALVAEGVLPAWACHTSPLSEDPRWSFYVPVRGNFGKDSTATAILDTATFQNSIIEQGKLTVYSGEFPALTGHNLFAGVSGCDGAWRDDTSVCLADAMGEVIFKLTAPVDVTAWNSKYDAATP